MQTFVRAKSVLKALKLAWACRKGASAVEFALLSPVLVVGTFATVDAGMAVYDKMMITQVLRAGAQSAIAGRSEASVLAVLEDTASANFTVAGTTPAPGELVLDVTTHCSCPDALTTPVSCSVLCVGSASPNEFYDLSASVEFTGVILPTFTLSGEIVVMAQ